MKFVTYEAHHIVPEEVLEEEARHNVLVVEEGDHNLAELQPSSVMRFVEQPLTALQLTWSSVWLMLSRWWLAIALLRCDSCQQRCRVLIMTHDTYEGDHRNHPVGADRRSNQTCLLVLFLT